MRDPHVVSLRYRLIPSETTAFDNPPPLKREADSFKMQLEDDVVLFEMKEHYPDEESARQEAEYYLRAWEAFTFLNSGHPDMHFEFQDAEVIDRDPPAPGEPQVISMKGVASIEFVGSATLSVTKPRYPDPPDRFVLSADADTMLRRYEGYLNGREPLGVMAYFCVTLLERTSGGSRPAAARKYHVSRKVIDTLARLSTEMGDLGTVRKFPRAGPTQPASGREISWVETTVRAVIRRLGEYAFDPQGSWPTLAMSDLPRLASADA